MKVLAIFFFNFVFFVSQLNKAHSFCVFGNEDLHGDLTRAVVRSSDWLRQYYNKTVFIRPHTAGSMIVTLRLAGHQPDTLLSNFKNTHSLSINETLKNYLDNEIKTRGNFSNISTGRLSFIVQAVIAICENPGNFYGHDLYAPLLSGIMTFKKTPNFNNYFQYSLVAIALCNGGKRVPEVMVKQLVRGAYRKVSYHSVDIDALILIALTCVENRNMFKEIEQAKEKIVHQFITRQNNITGAFGNQYSTALVSEALVAARVHSDEWHCEKAMRNILSYQDEEGSFGTLLANIQITPSLLGTSMTHLKKFSCPSKVSPTISTKMITVRVNLVFNDTIKPVRTEPAVAITVLEGTTAYNILEAAKEQNACYTAVYKKYAFGRSVTSICGVPKNPMASLYWMIYVNGSSAKYGVDGLKPKDGVLLTFKYQKLTF